VAIGDDTVDFSGNCGNLTSVVGAFAVDEGLCSPSIVDGRATVRAFNTNTNKRIDLTFPVTAGDGTNSVTSVLNLEELEIAGVPGKASKIILDFLSPSGARTGKLLPSGNPLDVITIPAAQEGDAPKHINASLVDASNPAVFISYSDLRYLLQSDDLTPLSFSDIPVSSLLETIRQTGALRMGLDPTAKGQPKVVVLTMPNETDLQNGVDIHVQNLSMGVLHRAVPVTVALCVGVAANVEGTIVRDMVARARAGRQVGASHDWSMVRIAHPSGVMDVGARIDASGMVESASVVRTGRKLMKGVVWW